MNADDARPEQIDHSEHVGDGRWCIDCDVIVPPRDDAAYDDVTDGGLYCGACDGGPGPHRPAAHAPGFCHFCGWDEISSDVHAEDCGR